MGQVDDSFYSSVLNLLGAPVTPNTLQLCRDWQRFEGGSAAWNPWNTTQWAEGATVYNSAGVKNYPDEATGETATANTVRNGYYPDVLAAFKSDLPETEWGLNPAILDQINTWGTHGFAAYLQSIAKQPDTSTQELTPMFTPLVVHITDAGGQYFLDSDGTAYEANGNYPGAVPMTADAYNKCAVNRQTKYAAFVAALGAR